MTAAAAAAAARGLTPPAAGWFFVINLCSALFAWAQLGRCLQTDTRSRTRLGLGFGGTIPRRDAPRCAGRV